jgi:AmmeMemoRadiSam system protein B
MPIVRAFIVPHPPIIIPRIGRGEEIKIEKTVKSYNEIAEMIAEIKPDTLIVTSPHSVMYSDYIHISPGMRARGDFGEFGAPDVAFDAEYDSEFVRELSKLAEEEDIPAGTLGEKKKTLDHGTMVPLNFINKHYKNYKLVRISISGLSPIDHYRFGKCISKAADNLNRRAVLVASGDLSHMLKEEGPYGYTEEGPLFDSQVTEAMAKGDFLRFMTFEEDFCETAAECGLRSFIIMAGALDGRSVESNLLSYEGPFGVGYAVASFEVKGQDDRRKFDAIYNSNEKERLKQIMSEEDEYVSLARK